jgi:hypothetical protein
MYLPEIDARCTFCRILDNNTGQRDGFLHVFFQCVTTKRLLISTLEKVNFNMDVNSVEFKKLYWFGLRENKKNRQVWLLFFNVVRYSVYKFKLKKNIPNATSFLKEIVFRMSKICLASRKFLTEFLNTTELTWFSGAIG